MSYMFRENKALPTIDLTGLKIPALTNANNMFRDCTNLKSVI